MAGGARGGCWQGTNGFLDRDYRPNCDYDLRRHASQAVRQTMRFFVHLYRLGEKMGVLALGFELAVFGREGQHKHKESKCQHPQRTW